MHWILKLIKSFQILLLTSIYCPHDISLVGGTYIGQIYIQDTVSPETVTISASVVNTLFSDHDAVKGEFYEQKFQNVIVQLLFDTRKFYNF